MVICASCSGENVEDARFCSNCGARLSVEPAQVAARPPTLGEPPPPPPAEAWQRPAWTSEPGFPPPPVQKSRRPWLWFLVPAVLAAAGGVTAFLLLRNTSPIHFPDSIAGAPRETSPIAQGVIEGMNREATFGGHSAQSAIYGTEASPSFIVLAYDFGYRGPVSAVFDGGAAGFARSSGGTVDLSATQVQTRGSTQYECAPVTVSTRSGDLCVWVDSKTLAVLVLFNQSSAPIDMAATIHDDVVS